MSRKNLTEAGAGTITPVAEAGKTPKLKIQLITPGWGSSGYYSAEVLEAAAKAGAWPAGTQMYLDHADAIERETRPERSVKDIAAALAETAYWDGQAVVAEADPVGAGRIYATDKAFLEAVGVSVSSMAEVEQGEAEGRKGWIVKEIFADTFNSVDFVTHAGRGGRVLQLVESARRTEEAAEPVVVKEASAEDTHRAVQDAVGNAYNDRDAETWTWLRDYDPDEALAYFEVSVGGKTTTFQQSYAVGDDGVIALTGERIEVIQTTTFVPVHPAGQSTTTKEHTMPEIEEGATVTVKETWMRQLEADAGRVPALEAKVATETARADAAEQDLAVETAREYARKFGTDRVKESNGDLPSPVVDKIVASAMLTIPLTEADKAADRRLDTTAFGKQVDEARTAEETYLASIVEAGHRVRGVGSTDSKVEVTEAQTKNVIAGVFGRTVKEA
jgi:hypothetical protein